MFNTAHIRPTQGLGWAMEEDSRLVDHPLRANRLPADEVPIRNVNYLMPGYPLDQGQTGTCVGHGVKHFELIAPVRRTKRLGYPTAIDFYLEATKRDPWHNGEPDTGLQDGTSVTAAMLALRDVFGYIESFDWTQDIAEVLQFMSLPDGGPVVLGLPWYQSMFTTGPDGIVKVDKASGLAGGHCITASWISVSRRLIGGPNSWGRPIDFGKLNRATGFRDGRWRMTWEDLGDLLLNGGVACAARERRPA